MDPADEVIAVRTDDGDITPLRAPSLVDLSYDRLRDLILNGALASGTKLNEVKLAERLGVSRGTLRVAIRRLTDDGLLQERPRQGTMVRRWTGSDIVDIYNMRLGIETVAARLAVRRGADLASLRRILDDMRDAAARDDLDGTMKAEYAFHLELCTISGNGQLADVYRSLQTMIRSALSYDNRGNEVLPDLPRRHEPIVEALESGDERLAARAVHSHIVGHVDEVLTRHGASADALLPPLD
jgi:DNA-binding GntR family transcriptional regulator